MGMYVCSGSSADRADDAPYDGHTHHRLHGQEEAQETSKTSLMTINNDLQTSKSNHVEM